VLEAGKFDGLFIADALGVLDTYQGRIDATLRHGVQTPNIDPLLIVSGMAGVTHRLGFARANSPIPERGWRPSEPCSDASTRSSAWPTSARHSPPDFSAASLREDPRHQNPGRVVATSRKGGAARQ
jgi:hypothetical protein